MKATTMKDQQRERKTRTEGVNIVKCKGRNHYVVCQMQDIGSRYGTRRGLCAIKQFTERKLADAYWEQIKNGNAGT